MEQEHNEQNEASGFIKLDKRGSKAHDRRRRDGL